MQRLPQLKNEHIGLVDPVDDALKQPGPGDNVADIPLPPPPTLKELYRQAVLRCLVADNMTWVENAFLLDDYPDLHDAANALRHLVVRHLLKECGDAKGAALILEALSIDLGVPEDLDQKFFRLLCRYTAQELDAIDPSGIEAWPGTIWPGSEPNAISLVIWGDDYIERFDEYCVKSLAADGNIPALKARGPVLLLIHTAEQDVEKIRNLRSLRRLGVKLRIWAVPDELLEVAKGDNKYWLLGALQSIHLFHASRRGANFLPIFPDGFYSARYFESLLELTRNGEDAIFLSGFKASRKGVAGHLKEYSKRNAYAVPATKLIQLALQYVNPFILECFVDPLSESLPRNRMLFTHCGNCIEIRAPHYNPALIRNSVIRRIPSRYLMTLDSEIDKVLPPTSMIHFRSAQDDYFATELIDEEAGPLQKVGFDEYAKFFVEHANLAHLRFERSSYQIAIQPEWLATPTQVSTEDVKVCFDRICGLVEKRIEQADHFERPHVVWVTLKAFAEMDLGGRELELVVAATEAARVKLIARAYQLYAEGRFAELDRMVAPVLKVREPLAQAVLLAGHCRHHLGLRKDALQLYRRAEEIDPDLPELKVCLAAFRQYDSFSEAEQEALLPGFSLPRAQNIETRRFLDLVAAPHLNSLYTNDNMIVFERALTFLHDAKFMRSLVKSSAVLPGTVDDRTWRVHILLWAARSALSLEGDFVELGTFRAYFAGCIVDNLDFGSLDRKLYLYDTFEGLPDDAVVEEHLPDSFYSALKEHYSAPDIHDSVRSRFAKQPNVTVVKGKLPDTLREVCPDRIAWLHVDLNSAVHEIGSLEYLWNRISIGGFIILEDYGVVIFSRRTQAYQAFFKSKGLTIAELPTGQGLVIKTRDS
ncbi:MAG: O-methyltransferase [Bradyrhizobium sp.]|jgi:hypothetical protein|nr:O-methyltransferase [Bradyrhizobium sp.]